MIAALKTEFRKFRSTRMWWVLLAIMVVYMSGMAMAMALAFTLAPGGESGLSVLGDTQTARMIYSICLSMGYVFPVVLGTVQMTGEFRYQTITPTLLAQPNRTRFLVSKMLAALPIGVVYGLLGTLGCVAGGALGLTIGKMPTGLGEWAIQKSLLGSFLGLALWCVVGVGFGALVRNQVAAIVILLAFTQLVEPIARIALGQFSLTSGVAKFLPGAAGDAMAGGSIYTSIDMGSGSAPGLLQPWQGALVLLGYALVFAFIGRITTLSRDIG